MAIGGKRRRANARAKKVGAEVEESIRQDGEDQKLQYASSKELFQVDNKGGDDGVLTKRQKLNAVDPLIRPSEFVSDRANRYEINRVKKLKQVQTVETKAKKPTSGGPSLLWGSDGKATPAVDATKLDEYVAPAVIKQIKVGLPPTSIYNDGWSI